jgi:protease I
MAKDLEGFRVAILVENGFEQVELTEPRKALEAQGAVTEIVSPHIKVKAWNRTNWGEDFMVDAILDSVSAEDYDALLLPGGVLNPDRLRVNEQACALVRDFFSLGKPVAAICHGPWTLINAGVVEGRRMTSYHSISRDLENAGAEWVDEPVVVDRGLVTSRKPADIPAFNQKMIEVFAQSRRGR